MAKVLVDALGIESTDNAHDVWWKKAVRVLGVCFLLFDNPKIDVVKIVFDNCIDYRSVALKIAEGTW